MRRFWGTFFLAAFFAGIAFAAAGAEVTNAVSDLCNGAKALMPPAAMLMTVAGALVYGAGQLLGAETRARAVVWATNLVTGGVVSTLIVSVAPPVVSAVYPDAVDCGACVSQRDAQCGGENGRCCGGLACVGGRCACSVEREGCGGDNPPCCGGMRLQCANINNGVGTCEVQEAQRCNNNNECAGGQVCRGAGEQRACTGRGGEGELCDAGDNEDCVAGLACNEEGRCEQQGIAPGGQCNANAECRDEDDMDYVCRPQGNAHTCQRLGNVDDRCDANDFDCIEGLTCSGEQGSETCQGECGYEGDECTGGNNRNRYCCSYPDVVCRKNDVDARVCIVKGNAVGAKCDAGENEDCAGPLVCGSRYRNSNDDSIEREVCCKGDGTSCSAGAGSNSECCTYQNSRQVCRTVGATRACTSRGWNIGNSCDDATDCAYNYWDCYAGACCVKLDLVNPNTCGANNQCCNQNSNSCIQNACRAKRGQGEVCDANDNNDCQTGLLCQLDLGEWKCGGQQGRGLGENCVNDADCRQDMEQLYCADPTNNPPLQGICCKGIGAGCAIGRDCCSGSCGGAPLMCVGRENGQQCTIGQQCRSGRCNNGRCTGGNN